MSLDFTAVDFETANSYRGSPCSVGMVKVRDGQIVDESSTLIHPPAGYDHFDGFNISLHGITAQMVADAPRWPPVLDRIVDYVASDTMVCHNAGFDVGVMRYACIADQVPWPRIDFLCTLVLARRALRLPSYRLSFVAAECDVSFVSRHDATDDARCAALIATAMARKQGADTLGELAQSLHVHSGTWRRASMRPAAVRTSWSVRTPTRTLNQTTRSMDALSCSPARCSPGLGRWHGRMWSG